MGTMIFQLPPNLPSDALEELERASVAGGQDHMPYATQVQIDDNKMILHRSVDESGCLLTPWTVTGAGQLMVSTATLMERLLPYQLPLELARGKINQLRGQAADWLLGGLLIPDALTREIREAVLTFSRTVANGPADDMIDEANRALELGYRAAEGLVQAYISQVFSVRHARQQQLSTFLGCRVDPTPPAPLDVSLRQACNLVQLPMAWGQIEPVENQFDWSEVDARVDALLAQGYTVVGGPLVDFSGFGLPGWLWEKETDLPSLAGYLGDFVQLSVRRYQGKIRGWQVTAGSNYSGVVAEGDEELLWLTIRLIEAARRIDPSAEVVAGIAQPWGDYLAHEDRHQSPFVFVDTLIRTGIKLSALDLEIIFGVSPRGSYCRDLLEVSRILDLYALLGVPLQVTLGYPSAPGKAPLADPDLRADAGQWRDGFTPEVQAQWAEAFATLCLCKPYVRAVVWSHFQDNIRHQFPHCGLVDAKGKAKPALQRLIDLRERHLK